MTTAPAPNCLATTAGELPGSVNLARIRGGLTSPEGGEAVSESAGVNAKKRISVVRAAPSPVNIFSTGAGGPMLRGSRRKYFSRPSTSPFGGRIFSGESPSPSAYIGPL